ncbi:hypothetical protein [Rhizobium tumorigenes]|uniref:hypothetical protein n=1 Tax=Rhizobium tumorigenes TaxID=2041385 RepID=UPI0024203960|nr:hypothetical protein [Rhizobium tumorigenes]WFS01587.1 hypothetical protein PR016_02835 [Rhizobium tumorigenes]
MTANKDTIVSWLADLSGAIVVDVDDQSDIANRLGVAAELDASGFASEAMDLTRIIAESVDASASFDRLSPPSTLGAGDTIDAINVLLALALSVAACRVDWPSRPLARNARRRISEAGDVGLAVATDMGGDGAALYAWLSSVVDVACRLVSDQAANAVPIVRVETGISQPSTVLAYRLYGNASRAASLVDIAAAATPMVMPSSFDALAS